jgi:hypothetical protein
VLTKQIFGAFHNFSIPGKIHYQFPKLSKTFQNPYEPWKDEKIYGRKDGSIEK